MEKQYISTQKYLLIGPRKIRDVVAIIKGLKPQDAVTKLEFIHKKSSLPLAKTIKTAIANAVQGGVSADDLVFKEIQISEGPRLKRGRPVSRGMWHPYKKRMSHIRVVLESKNGTKS